MKRLLLTGYDDAFAPIGELTAPRMLAYASKHGMDFRCIRQYPSGVPAYWEKMGQTLSALKEGYEVMWLDGDQVVCNPEIIPEATAPFTASLDWGADAADSSFFSMCGFVAKPESMFLFEWVLNHWVEYMDKDFPEQTPMRELYRTSNRAKEAMGIVGRRVFNAIHPMLMGVQEPWEQGDFCCHLSHVPVEQRVKWFHEIVGQLNP